MSAWRNSISQGCAPERINDINSYITIKCQEHMSPIDIFYQSIKVILPVANVDFLNNHPTIGPLLLVGIISATENYFRDILSRFIQICPIAQECSADQSINLGSVIWHSGRNLERGSFEHLSLAGSDSIIKTCRNYLNFKIDKTELTYATLQEYDKICELRHSIVHSGAIIAGKNAIKLGINSCRDIVTIKVIYDQIQECASICTTLVVSFNIDIFEVLCKRWAIDWRQKPSWNSNKQNMIFNEIWNTCFSIVDEGNGMITHPLSMIKCRNKVKREFGLS